MLINHKQHLFGFDGYLGRSSQPVSTVTWLSLRPEYWLPRSLDDQLSCYRLHGISCVAFAIGTGGAAWLDQLAASEWLSGLEPGTEDLAAAGGGRPAGRMTISVEYGFAEATPAWPAGFLATVAVPAVPTPDEEAVTLALVSLLRSRRKANRFRMPVVATLAGSASGTDGFVRELQARGAFVLQAGPSAEGDHVHHFPLRAATQPREGRLICCDLMDYLACWPPGSIGDRHVVPFAPGQAVWAADHLLDNPGELFAVNVDFHLDLDHPDCTLLAIDGIYSDCTGRLLPGFDGHSVFTNSERMDGRTGTGDVVVVHRPSSPSDVCQGTVPGAAPPVRSLYPIKPQLGRP